MLGGTSLASGAVGDLTYQDCITGERSSGPDGRGACTAIGSTVAHGTYSGLDYLRSAAVSPDGKWVYAASGWDDAVASFRRNPDTGALTYEGCITGNIEAGPGGSGACDAIPGPSGGSGATLEGYDSGLDYPIAVAVSPDGTSLFAVSENDDAVASFKVDPSTGALTYQGCITGETQSSSACTPIPRAASDGSNSGLDGAYSVAVSPRGTSGTSVYVASELDDAVASFEGGPNGALSYQGCITGEQSSVGACAPNGSGGTTPGLDGAYVVAVNETSLYVAANNDDAVASFQRNPDTGALTYKGCISGRSESTGAGACTAPSGGATPGGSNSGFDTLFSVAVSPNGDVYAASRDDDAVSSFRGGPNGALSYRGCITGETQSSGPCTAIPSAAADGTSSGLDALRSVMVSPDDDGKSVYAGSRGDDAVDHFNVTSDGTLAYQGCVGAKTTSACTPIPKATELGGNTGLDSLFSVALSPDGKSIYVAARYDDSVAWFKREVMTTPPPTDTTAPTVSSVSPADGSVGVARGTDVTVTFSEAMDRASAEAAFSLTPTATGTFSWNGNAMTFRPSASLAGGTQYTARVGTGAKDAAVPGNPLAAEKSWSFTTINSSTVSPAAAVLETGTVRGGAAADLGADDNLYYEVNSTTSGTRTTSWWGRFTAVPNSLSNLKVTYKGKNSQTCTQRLYIKRWTNNAWVQLDSRSVGTTEVRIDALPGGNAADYVSGTAGDGELQLRVRCTRSKLGFLASGDLMQITYDWP